MLAEAEVGGVDRGRWEGPTVHYLEEQYGTVVCTTPQALRTLYAPPLCPTHLPVAATVLGIHQVRLQLGRQGWHIHKCSSANYNSVPFSLDPVMRAQRCCLEGREEIGGGGGGGRREGRNTGEVCAESPPNHHTTGVCAQVEGCSTAGSSMPLPSPAPPTC